MDIILAKKYVLTFQRPLRTQEEEERNKRKKERKMKCPYCSAAQGRCTTTTTGKLITECTSCGRVVEERQSHPHHIFHLRAQDNPLCLVTPDLPPPTLNQTNTEINEEEDPFEPTGFITAFSTWSLEPCPLYLQSSLSFSGYLAELERTLESSSTNSSSSVVVDNLRAYMQIIDVSSILGLDCDISDHAFQLFRDCCSATCLRNRSVEALATAALVQAIREAQEPRTLQVLSSFFSSFQLLLKLTIIMYSINIYNISYKLFFLQVLFSSDKFK